ncbi:MAG: nucleotidyltransferase domain-containing protein [Chitinophagaceae bacterium]|nr:nucleotidyltransferase domain-containing protein [Chitinophagaceae bacterium]
MALSKEIIQRIKQTVQKAEPGAQIILFGSYARGDNRDDSDIDLLILSQNIIVSDMDKKHIISELYDVELETGYPISSVILSSSDWNNRYFSTPFYFNIKQDGITL